MNKVIIVESGAKIKTISRFLRGEYKVIATGGHIADLPTGSLGIDIDNDFLAELSPNNTKLKKLKDQLVDCDEIYLATDPDREGEGIAADIVELCHLNNRKVFRIKFNAIVYHAVIEALEKRGEINQNLASAQKARRSLDRLIGFILSSITKFDTEGPGAPAVGRVLIPALSLVIDREEEIKAFVRKVTWVIKILCVYEENEFEAEYKGALQIANFDFAKKRISEINEIEYLNIIEASDHTVESINPPPPFTTDSLQQFADYRLGLPPQLTMKIAQILYEGVELNGKQQSLITYMRTDSPRMSPDALKYAKETIQIRDDLDNDLYKGRKWELSSSDTQDAHEGIRPVAPHKPELFPEALKGVLKEKEYQLYNIIYYRYLASQMKSAQIKKRSYELGNNIIKATALSSKIIDYGFLNTYRKIDTEYGPKENILPNFEKDMKVRIIRSWPEKVETQPPRRYREGGLVTELKKRGIGRPSTYAKSISKIQDYKYVRKAGNTLRPTLKGLKLATYLRDKYQEVISYEYTAKMEEFLGKIEHGELTYKNFLGNEWENWLKEPYRLTKGKGWLDCEGPSPAQIKFLNKLAGLCGVEIPQEVIESKTFTGEWIERLKKEAPCIIELTDIESVDVKGVSCFRFKLFFTKKPPDEIKEYLKTKKFKFQRDEQLGAFYHYQRQDKDNVIDKKNVVIDYLRNRSNELDYSVVNQ